MSTSIPSDIEQYVQRVLASGRYDSADEVIREAFRLLQTQDRQFDALRTDVKAGFDQLDRGEGMELDDAGLRELFDDIQARGQQRYQAARKNA